MRSALPWVIYGANGVTGRQVLAQALKQEQRPIVAGRDAPAVRNLANHHGLEAAIVSLDDRAALEALLRRSSRVLHTAGPFSRTAAPMLEACLASATPYLDMSGELDVIAATIARDAEARRVGIPSSPPPGSVSPPVTASPPTSLAVGRARSPCSLGWTRGTVIAARARC